MFVEYALIIINESVRINNTQQKVLLRGDNFVVNIE